MCMFCYRYWRKKMERIKPVFTCLRVHVYLRKEKSHTRRVREQVSGEQTISVTHLPRRERWAWSEDLGMWLGGGGACLSRTLPISRSATPGTAGCTRYHAPGTWPWPPEGLQPSLVLCWCCKVIPPFPEISSPFAWSLLYKLACMKLLITTQAKENTHKGTCTEDEAS